MQTLYPIEDPTSPDGDDNVLSQELKGNFDAVRAMLSQRNTTCPKAEEAKHEAAARIMAVKTALAVDSEISRLSIGIAELEALFAAQEGQSHNVMGGIVFPSLPAVVIVEDEEDETVEAAGDASNNGNGELVQS